MTTLLPSVAVLEMTYRCNHACRFCACSAVRQQPPIRFSREHETDAVVHSVFNYRTVRFFR